MNLIRLISVVILLTLSSVKSVAQNCPLTLNINYPNGEKGCLVDLPISKIIDKEWKKPISEVALYAAHYAIATSSICNHSGIGTAPRALAGMSISTQKEKAKQQLDIERKKRPEFCFLSMLCLFRSMFLFCFF